MGRKFFQVYDEWSKLTPQEKLETQIYYDHANTTH
jgi:hypothetical protein